MNYVGNLFLRASDARRHGALQACGSFHAIGGQDVARGPVVGHICFISIDLSVNSDPSSSFYSKPGTDPGFDSHPGSTVDFDLHPVLV
ncbi:hypothetical protein EVAR_103370_1 [Eumeta japonica]|uniref:Uncharacterized protein n=1 Tax=Eumeta variegata TaxID=151549 RepID=A0A4C1Y977_EUMVA|nr:hypothetical protein EVAR_103370_1 [Eumeta japonica]